MFITFKKETLHTFDVKDTRVRPDVLIVTNQEPIGIGRQGSLSSARKTKEKGHVISLDTHIRRRVKGELTELNGLKVMHDGKYALLHFACILCA